MEDDFPLPCEGSFSLVVWKSYLENRSWRGCFFALQRQILKTLVHVHFHSHLVLWELSVLPVML